MLADGADVISKAVYDQDNYLQDKYGDVLDKLVELVGLLAMASKKSEYVFGVGWV